MERQPPVALELPIVTCKGIEDLQIGTHTGDVFGTDGHTVCAIDDPVTSVSGEHDAIGLQIGNRIQNLPGGGIGYLDHFVATHRQMERVECEGDGRVEEEILDTLPAPRHGKAGQEIYPLARPSI